MFVHSSIEANSDSLASVKMLILCSPDQKPELMNQKINIIVKLPN